MQSGELKSGMPDEAEQENIVAWYLVQSRKVFLSEITQLTVMLYGGTLLRRAFARV